MQNNNCTSKQLLSTPPLFPGLTSLPIFSTSSSQEHRGMGWSPCSNFITCCVRPCWLLMGKTPHTLTLLQHGVPPWGSSMNCSITDVSSTMTSKGPRGTAVSPWAAAESALVPGTPSASPLLSLVFAGLLYPQPPLPSAVVWFPSSPS